MSSIDLVTAEPQPSVSYPLVVQYCGVCSLPVEYCDYSGSTEACRLWLRNTLPDVFAQLHSAVLEAERVAAERKAAAAAAAGGADAAGSAGEDDDEKKKKSKRGGKGNKKAAAAAGAGGQAAKVMPDVHITLQRSNRGKTKSVTVIKGMAATGLNLKDVAKQFSKKFACSSSATGPDEIIVQGDVADDLLDYIPEQWPQISEDDIEDLGDVKR